MPSRTKTRDKRQPKYKPKRRNADDTSIGEMEAAAKRFFGFGKNGDYSENDAAEMSRKFHGRDIQNVEDLVEDEEYIDKVAVLGELEQLIIVCPDEKHFLPIEFKAKKDMGVGISGKDDNVVMLCCDPGGKQLLLYGGDQSLPLDDENVVDDLELSAEEIDKQFINIGRIKSITYFADKHHLQGPSYQKKGCSYEHQFGEEGGVCPDLFYDSLNARCLIVGGSYTVEDVGIKN